ncbi:MULTISPECIES: phosphocholine cytidylyltransferase family protein [unclassified Maridesulfovibrio]|uniref:phosphocholine cytidylyltransferase family protein n=1 Tax=unclassified Maridesulfovibrio TaxID=2794999 RepID=UPI003B3FEF19
MKGIILAAGRGSRMNHMTNDRPKCLLNLSGKPLLEWQLTSLRDGGVDDILVVSGYMADKLAGDFKTLYNPRWNKSNMIETLRQASSWLENEPCIVSYSDIVYHSDHVKSISKSPAVIAITFDTLWKDLWELRFTNPLSDAETFIQKDGFLKEIGNTTTNISLIQGQYMGLVKFTPEGWHIVSELLESLTQDQIDKLDMTALFNIMLKKDIAIETIPVNGRWCEADSMSDIDIYESTISQSEKTNTLWPHDWRIKA